MCTIGGDKLVFANGHIINTFIRESRYSVAPCTGNFQGPVYCNICGCPKIPIVGFVNLLVFVD